MTLKNQFIQILELFSNTPGRLNVFFEAHYWGRFQLLTNTAEVFPDPEGFIPLAQIQSPPFDTWLLLDTEQERIILRESDSPIHKVIAFSLEEFLGPEAAIRSAIKAGTTTFAFDERQNFSELLASDEYLITKIDDPEFFEDLEGYYQLLDLLAPLTQGDLQFTAITGKEKGTQKTFTLEKEAQQWTISTTRELFDNAFIQQLNTILVALGISDYTLSTSISKEMRMVLLKLSPEKFQLLDRMGLLI